MTDYHRTDPMQRCRKCGWEKETRHFTRTQTVCKACRKDYGKARAMGDLHRDAIRESEFRKLLDISRNEARFPGADHDDGR